MQFFLPYHPAMISHIPWLIGALWVALTAAMRVSNISSATSNATSTASFTSTTIDLDGPKISAVNSSAFDWWYFDVVSTDQGSLASVVVVFYTTIAAAFPFFPPFESVTLAQIAVSFPNGTLSSIFVPAEGATVSSDGNASSGDWHGSGLKWTHDGDSLYSISVDAPDLGITGSIRFRGVVPAHYPCGPAVAGQDMQVAPHIGWANALPDAASTVDLVVNGTKLAFSGAGYHDKNWSDQLFTANVASWYWGHGRVGPYSIVWFDYLALDGTEHVSAYAAQNGAIVAAGCDLPSTRVRPTGKNSTYPTYPPVRSTPKPSGYLMSLDLAEAGTLEVEVVVTLTLVDDIFSEYTRSVGNMTGVVIPRPGGQAEYATKVLNGTALFEQFKMTD
ncbi:hypothetical protein C8R43DRAFT_1030984 [Mycena crocata]|nr:hypothetical protein C8R43DRAFT_1030984 [Mycena crocata]